ncbi:MAG: phage tail protein [Proteobacteria bacterium]|nr:phage tail protein [Pseudomonadota bacterium]MBU1640079.1 phage tail protein [Pseudomonadota bacterium]
MSQPLISININPGLDRLAQDLAASKGQIDKALVSTSRKVQAWLNTQLIREMAREIKIKQKALRGRFKKSLTRSGQEIYASIWIGVNPFEAQLTGKPRQLNKGVRVRSWLFDKAFTASIYSSQEKVWRRKSGSRFPVVKMMIPIAEQMEKILPRYEAPAARKFEEIFEHELKFAMGWFK